MVVKALGRAGGTLPSPGLCLGSHRGLCAESKHENACGPQRGDVSSEPLDFKSCRNAVSSDGCKPPSVPPAGHAGVGDAGPQHGGSGSGGRVTDVGSCGGRQGSEPHFHGSLLGLSEPKGNGHKGAEMTATAVHGEKLGLI